MAPTHDDDPTGEALRVLRELLAAATQAIEPGYFELTRADEAAEDGVQIFRERIYCYELYHQLRLRWPEHYGYSLGGEPDKRGHPFFKAGELVRANPDLIVHQPGTQHRNLCVLEVKPANARFARMEADIRTLNDFVSRADYALGVLLIYGDVEQWKLERLAAACGPGTEVWWQRQQGTPGAPRNGTGQRDDTSGLTSEAPSSVAGTPMKQHVAFWDPDPYAPLEKPRWEEQVLPSVRVRVRELLARFAAGDIPWDDFIQDRKCADGGWGMKMCLWHQHHKNDPRHKNLGRPFWSVDAYRHWVQNIESLPPQDVRDRRGAFAKRTLERMERGRLRAFLRHEHVVPKSVMIKWLVRELDNVDVILAKNVCCVITKEEDAKLARDTHPAPSDPWRRYAGTGIVLLFNPDWPDAVVEDLTRHGLLTTESRAPFGARANGNRAAPH
ncbi:MAG: hypothetical protein KC464_26975 [Myxococcales bacterium]|nr:hypothetical protein [Myxococcales bacterium]